MLVNQKCDLILLMSKLERLSDAEGRQEVRLLRRCVPAHGTWGSVRTTAMQQLCFGLEGSGKPQVSLLETSPHSERVLSLKSGLFCRALVSLL